jgi:Mrp family chromosome partitioning ATPase
MEKKKGGLHIAAPGRIQDVDPPTVDAADDDGELQSVELGVFEYEQTRVLDVPPAALAAARVITGRGQDHVTRAYKLLRTRVLQRLLAEHWQTIAVVSPSGGDGKTLTAINLAISIASTRTHTSLLVDLDWQRPSVHTYFGYDPPHDVCDYLLRDQPMSDVLVNPGVPRFCFVPCARPVPDSSEHLADLGPYVHELKTRYRNRIVLFDVPPLLLTDDALSFLPLVDCVLLVVQEGKTKAKYVEQSLELIDPDRLLGSVINNSRQVLPRY